MKDVNAMWAVIDTLGRYVVFGENVRVCTTKKEAFSWSDKDKGERVVKVKIVRDEQ